MAAASRSLATALWRARVASGSLPQSYTTTRDTTPLYYQYPSPLEARAAFERRVFGFFQDDRAELCNFLGRPVPDAPYPWENRGGG